MTKLRKSRCGILLHFETKGEGKEHSRLTTQEQKTNEMYHLLCTFNLQPLY
jgi:hypothetical protein